MQDYLATFRTWLHVGTDGVAIEVSIRTGDAQRHEGAHHVLLRSMARLLHGSRAIGRGVTVLDGCGRETGARGEVGSVLVARSVWCSKTRGTHFVTRCDFFS